MRTCLGRVLVGAVVLGALVLVPRPAGAAPAVDTALSISAPEAVRIGRPATVTATLTAAGPVPVPGVEVVLERKVDDSSWDQVAATATSPDGTAAFSVPVSTPASSFRARFAGTPALSPSVSETVVVAAVQVTTSLLLDGTKSLVDETSGELLVRWTGADALPVRGLVRVYQHALDKPWSKVGAVWTNSAGRARVTIKPRVDTWYEVRGEGTAGWTGARSGTWKVDNRPPGAVIALPWNAPKPTPLAPQRRGVGSGASASIVAISDTVWARMYGRSWTPGCPVGRSGLRYLTVNYWGFDGYRHRGELVVRSTVAMKFAIAMTKLYNARVPIRAMFLPDRFGYSGQSGGANDYASMRHDNTSAFNCRLVTGDSSSQSPHSYGSAIDLNPWENPFRSQDGWLPNAWWGDKQIGKYAWKRSDHIVVRLMRESGFSWPYGRYDAQHFRG